MFPKLDVVLWVLPLVCATTSVTQPRAVNHGREVAQIQPGVVQIDFSMCRHLASGALAPKARLELSQRGKRAKGFVYFPSPSKPVFSLFHLTITSTASLLFARSKPRFHQATLQLTFNCTRTLLLLYLFYKTQVSKEGFRLNKPFSKEGFRLNKPGYRTTKLPFRSL